MQKMLLLRITCVYLRLEFLLTRKKVPLDFGGQESMVKNANLKKFSIVQLGKTDQSQGPKKIKERSQKKIIINNIQMELIHFYRQSKPLKLPILKHTVIIFITNPHVTHNG